MNGVDLLCRLLLRPHQPLHLHLTLHPHGHLLRYVTTFYCSKTAWCLSWSVIWDGLGHLFVFQYTDGFCTTKTQVPTRAPTAQLPPRWSLQREPVAQFYLYTCSKPLVWQSNIGRTLVQSILSCSAEYVSYTLVVLTSRASSLFILYPAKKGESDKSDQGWTTWMLSFAE